MSKPEKLGKAGNKKGQDHQNDLSIPEVKHMRRPCKILRKMEKRNVKEVMKKYSEE